MAKAGESAARTPMLEWIAAGVGLLLLLALLAVIGRELLVDEPEQLPAIEVRATRVAPAARGFVVEFEAANQSNGTGAAVQIEGRLTSPGAEPETSTATLDYVPGKGVTSGGLFFSQDPREGKLELRATGFQTP